MSRGGRLRRGSEPTRTTNLDGIFTLNECADYIAEDKWPTIPDAVSDLGLVGGDGTLDLSWTAPSTNGIPISLYSIEYTPNGGSATTVTTSNTSYQLTGLTNDTEYSVRVGAIIGDRVNYGSAVTETPSDLDGISYTSGWSGLGTPASPASTSSYSGSRYFTANVNGTLYWTFYFDSDGGESVQMQLKQGGTVLVSEYGENESLSFSRAVTAGTEYEMVSGYSSNNRVTSLYILKTGDFGLVKLAGNYAGSGTSASPWSGSSLSNSLFRVYGTGRTIYWTISADNSSGDYDADAQVKVNSSTVASYSDGNSINISGNRAVNDGDIIGFTGSNLRDPVITIYIQ